MYFGCVCLFKQKTAYEMRISGWSSDVCSSDLGGGRALVVRDALADHWLDAGLIDDGTFNAFQFGDQQLRSISCGPSQTLCPVSEAKSPDTKAEIGRASCGESVCQYV